MVDNPEVLALIVKYLNNPEDLTYRLQVEEYRNQSDEHDNFFLETKRLWDLSAKSALLQKVDESAAVANLQSRLSSHSTNKKTKTISLRTNVFRWAAASIVLIGLASITYFFSSRDKVSDINKPYVSDFDPGSNKAVLVLADGRKISLTDIGNGAIAKEAGLSITKTSDGQLIYTVAKETTNGKSSLRSAFNTIETPKGGMWQVKLPDGSSVWLNAASSLTYPLAFSGRDKRVVELKGEAYFEVAKDEKHPFIVKTTRQEVEVLGTHFNINSYSDESTVKTTLLEGSVRVKAQQISLEAETLKPGQQSVLSAQAFSVKNVDVEEAIAWKNGYFMFNNEKQESIMRKIARWYNVQVEYADAAAREVTYYGSISRFENVSKVLRKFEQTGEVKFEVEKDKIIVYKEDKD
jgi:ferric-dicitrate binding protein FerR (iron transport regulator)